MNDTRDDLRELLAAVVIDSPAQFRIRGEIYQISVLPGTPEPPLLPELRKALYARLYARSDPQSAGFRDELRNRTLGAELSAANCGKGTWEPGWIIQGPEEDGRIPVRKDQLTLWVTPLQLRSLGNSARTGTPCRIRIGKELRELMPGFYIAIGDGDERSTRDEEGRLVRFYFHVEADGAVSFIRTVTMVLNRAGVPFRAKVVNQLEGFPRADAAVLYVDKRDYKRVAPLLSAIHEPLRPLLRKPVPLFTKRLADGIGLAEDPQTEDSFGQHRCRLVAQGLWSAFGSGRADDDSRMTSISELLAAAGLNVAALYLQPGSVDDYVPLGESGTIRAPDANAPKSVQKRKHRR